jgi:hypothetical protein
MPKPFDATFKDLAVVDPVQFLTELDTRPRTPVWLLNVDLSTVTTSTDIAFGLGDPLVEIVHFDAQAGADADRHRDLLVYNALLHRQYRVPVHSVLLLLRPQATHSSQTGTIRYEARPGRGIMNYGYELLRLWERPVEAFLTGGLGTLPLAPLSKLPEGIPREDAQHRVVEEVIRRLQQEATPEMVGRLLMAAFVLGGLVIDRSQLRTLFQGVRPVRESEAYQMILDEGREEGEIRGVQRTLIHLARHKLGEPDEAALCALKEITDLDRLDRMSVRLFEVGTWAELLQTP